MSKFASQKAPVTAPVTTTGPASIWTNEGGIAWERDAKSDLFLLAVANMVSQDTFYEAATERDERFRKLIWQVVQEDPEWIARFVPYLRDQAQMRSASVVLAAEYVAAGGPGGRGVIASALQRADEPAEMLAYWTLVHGRNVPQPVKRGVADAVVRLYNQRAALRYDGTGSNWRMGDVLDLVHAKPKDDEQGALFRYLLDKRHNRQDPRTAPSLNRIWADRELMDTPADARRGYLRTDPGRNLLAEAGWSWERLAGWLPGGMDGEAWESVIPRMGYMALLRNLRNFDEKGIGKEAAESVAAKLADPEEVARSRQFPLRFLSAWSAVSGMRWGPVLEEALGHSLGNVPSLRGRSLILVDVSGSMMGGYHGTDRSGVAPWQTAAIFGAALARQAEKAELHAYSNGPSLIDVGRGDSSILRVLDRVRTCPTFGGGTQTIQTVAALYQGHDRVVVLTDEQAFDAARGQHAAVDAIPLIYTFNLVGYRQGHQPSGRDGRYSFGGLTDVGFRMMDLLEGRRSAGWPF